MNEPAEEPIGTRGAVYGNDRTTLGYFERRADGWVATGPDGTELGVFASRKEAKAAITRTWSPGQPN